VTPDEKFIEEYRPLVGSIAEKLRSRNLRGEKGDLVAAGFQGLLEARDRYDASRGVQFTSFAYYRIRGAMIDWLRAQGAHSRRAWDHIKAAQTADLLGEGLVEARAADPGARTDKTRTAASLDSALGKLTTAFVMSALGCDEATDEHTAERAMIGDQQALAVREAVEALPERERALIQGFYFEERRFDEVAASLGISKSWASRLHVKALELLGKRLRETT